MSITKSIILNVDSYKVGMDQMYPPNTSGVYSYIESRGGCYNKTVFFGLQAYIKEYLLTPITQQDIDFAERVFLMHGEPFNKENWQYILDVHNGYLPLRTSAVAEGSVVPVNNVLVTIENTDPQCYWLTTWVETSLLRAVWYPTTVATQSWYIKNLILSYLEKNGDPGLIDFKLHDFGARGVSSFESSGLGGAAHLVNFMGTDNVTGVLCVCEYYNSDVAGFSIPATEHSVITAWGRDNEVDAYRNMITKFAKPNSIFACVSDSYDIFNAVEKLWGEQLKQAVVDSQATLVVRPDSGDPVEVCVKVVQLLDKKFGSYLNSKGYRVLNNVRIIQGDGVNQSSIEGILKKFDDIGYSADNIAFGMGGALLQQLDRDTQKFALKASAVEVNGIWRPISKDPVTDPVKKSKAGRWLLYKDQHGEFFSAIERQQESVLNVVYENGCLFNEISFQEVRNNAS